MLFNLLFKNMKMFDRTTFKVSKSTRKNYELVVAKTA